MSLSSWLKYTSAVLCGLAPGLSACGSHSADPASEDGTAEPEIVEPIPNEAGNEGSIDTTIDGGVMPTFDAGDFLLPRPLEDVQRDYVDLRFGMFLHFGILTYTGTWSQPNLDIKQFNPTKLDPAQWADAAVSAHMKF